MTSTLAPVLCVALILAGCRKSEEVPTYIDISSVVLSATDAQGGSTSKITDVWVSLDDRSVGVWELPARVPLIGSGAGRVTVTPGVKRNGTFDDRLRYPYYTSYSTDVDLSHGTSVGITPIVHYETATNFWMERFNDAGSLLTVSDNSDTTLLVFTVSDHPEVLLDGTSCGGFALETGRGTISLYTTEDFAPVNGPAYIELDYSNDVNLTVGLTYVESGITRYEPWVILVPTASEGAVSWNKVYIDVSTLFNVTGISQRDIYLAASLPPTQGTAHVYLDNLKLIRPGP